MQIELIGCTSAGKSTLARRMIRVGHELGVDTQLSDDFVLKLIGLDRVKNEFLRRRVIEFLSLLVCLIFWPRYHKFYRTAIRICLHVPGSWFYKFNVARIALRKIGIYEIIRRCSSDQQVILVDNEGVLQASHALLVHDSVWSPVSELPALLQSAPLPDVVIYVSQPISVLIERALQRGHNRISDRSHAKVEIFVRQAVEMFDELQRQPVLADRLLVTDGVRNAVATSEHLQNPFLGRAYRLVKTCIKDGAANNKPTTGLLAESQTNQVVRQINRPEAANEAGLAIRLLEALNRNGVEYCHWKSNIFLAQALSGEADLDLLVDQRALPETLVILTALGFKAAVPRFGTHTTGIFHYYGSDPQSGKLSHVHLYSKVLTGESFVKSHSLPFERMLLENSSSLGPVRVASKAAESVVFVLRTFIKYGSLPDWRQLIGKADHLREEWRWLQAGNDISEAVALLQRYGEVVDEQLFLKCVHALNGDSSLAKRVILALKVRRRLRVYAAYTPAKRFLAYVRVLWVQVRRRLGGNKKNKRLQSGGAVIAFVGADATGKTALVFETSRWLGDVFAVRTVHVGKPPSFWLTIPVNVSLPVARRLLPQLRHARFAHQGHPENHRSSHVQEKTEERPSLLYAGRAVALAWDRYRLLIKVKRWVAGGEIVICDRYPSGSIGAMDSPRLKEHPGHSGVKAALYDWLAGVERRLYDKIPPPDIALRLSVSIETAKQRNRERLKSDKHSEDYLETLYQQNHEWNRDGTKSIYDVSTENSIAETILRVKRAIWESL